MIHNKVVCNDMLRSIRKVKFFQSALICFSLSLYFTLAIIVLWNIPLEEPALTEKWFLTAFFTPFSLFFLTMGFWNVLAPVPSKETPKKKTKK